MRSGLFVENRDLLFSFVRRELKARYGTLTLGYLWSVLNPLLFTLVLFILFSKVVKLNIRNYPLYVLTGLLPWNFFQNGLVSSLNSISDNAKLLSKVYFPRHVVVFSSVTVSSILFALDVAIVIPFMFYYRVTPSLYLLLFPVSFVSLVSLVYGLSLLFSVVVIYFRDFNFIVRFLLRIGFYATPVFYSISFLPGKYALPYSLNPIVGIIEGMRGALYGSCQVPGWVILYSMVFSIVVLFTGRYVFEKFISRAIKIL